MKRFIYSAVGAGVLFVPLVAGAQIVIGTVQGEWQKIFAAIVAIVNFAIPAIFALGLIVFLWGLLKFLRAAGDESAATDGKRLIVWGVIIMFVMTAVWGLVGLINQLTGVSAGTVPTLPNVPSAR
ncbi:MAG: hypothetical protein AAB834_03270 [Patescibacteria group bacterium]